MRKFILLFFLLYVAKYGNSMPVSQSTLLSVRRLIHALPRCYNTSQPAIEPEHRLQAVCTDPLLGGYCAIIGWLLCDTSTMFVQSFHIAIITYTKTFEKNFNIQQAKRGCFGRYCFNTSMLVSAWILRRQGAGCDWLQKFRFLHVNVSF